MRFWSKIAFTYRSFLGILGSATRQYPLEGDYAKQRITAEVDGRCLKGITEANWGAVKVTMTTPLRQVTRELDHRCWAFGLCASTRPEVRYRFAGAITEKGLHHAQQLLTTIYQDVVSFQGKVDTIRVLCEQFHARLHELPKRWPDQPWMQERRRLRQLFKAGQLSQRDYQQRRKKITKAAPTLYGMQLDVRGEFRQRLREICGRAMEIYEANELVRAMAPRPSILSRFLCLLRKPASTRM